MVYKEYKTVLQPHMIKHRYNFSHDKISILKKKYADHMQKSGFDLIWDFYLMFHSYSIYDFIASFFLYYTCQRVMNLFGLVVKFKR